MARRGVELDSKGPVCQRFGEDCGHVFFKCKYVKLCWHELDMEDGEGYTMVYNGERMQCTSEILGSVLYILMEF